MAGRLRVGTSGWAYRAWIPRFYPPGTRADELLPAYAARLPAVEVNNTFYRMPSPEQVHAWTAAVPGAFRFVVKAQRFPALRALGDPEAVLPWLLPPYRAFGDRLGTILYRVGSDRVRDDAGLDRLLAAWPADLPVAFEFQHPSWEVDEVHARLRAAGASLVVTDLPDADPPTIRLIGPSLYLRLRRHDYTAGELDAWAARVEPFLTAGHDAFVFFRHDEVGRGGELALAFRERLAAFA